MIFVLCYSNKIVDFVAFFFGWQHYNKEACNVNVDLQYFNINYVFFGYICWNVTK